MRSRALVPKSRGLLSWLLAVACRSLACGSRIHPQRIVVPVGAVAVAVVVVEVVVGEAVAVAVEAVVEAKVTVAVMVAVAVAVSAAVVG